MKQSTQHLGSNPSLINHADELMAQGSGQQKFREQNAPVIQRVDASGLRINQPKNESFIYALGLLHPFFPSIDLQKEFEAAAASLGLAADDYYGVFSYQSTPDSNTSLTFRPFLYIAEKACWVFSINNIDTYLVVPRYSTELNEMIDALHPEKKQQTQALIGTFEGKAPENYGSGLGLSMVICYQLLSTATEAMLEVPLKLNDGKADEKRAMNYLAFNYDAIMPTGLELPKPLRAIRYQFYKQDENRTKVDVILEYFNKGIETSYACGIDVADQYPFIDYPLRLYVPDNN